MPLITLEGTSRTTSCSAYQASTPEDEDEFERLNDYDLPGLKIKIPPAYVRMDEKYDRIMCLVTPQEPEVKEWACMNHQGALGVQHHTLLAAGHTRAWLQPAQKLTPKEQQAAQHVGQLLPHAVKLPAPRFDLLPPPEWQQLPSALLNVPDYHALKQEKKLLRAHRMHVTQQGGEVVDRKSTRLNSSHSQQSRMPSSA